MNRRNKDLSQQEKTEKIWTRAIRGGDAAAFERLFRAYFNSLIAYARRYIQDTTIAEDIIQDVFVNVWNRRKQLDPDKSIKSYLYASVKNRALNHLRRLESDRKYHTSETLLTAIDLSPEEKWHRTVLVRSIESAVNQLPKKCREVFILSKYHQLTYKEIAQVLGLSVNTVETQMVRALKVVRKILAPLHKSSI